jgi:electron transport complex protein RnfC
VLLRSLFARKVGPLDLPTQAGRVIVDPVACWALGRWNRSQRPLDERPVQLFVRAERRDVAPRVVMARLGETVESFLQRCGTPSEGRQVIVNGMLAGEEVDPHSAVVAADTESVAVRARPEPEEPAACIACGWCLDHCPTALNPIGLYELSLKTDAAKLQRASPARMTNARESLYCLGCGLCSYVCPTRLPLMQGVLELQALAVRTAGTSVVPRTVDPGNAPPPGRTRS